MSQQNKTMSFDDAVSLLENFVFRHSEDASLIEMFFADSTSLDVDEYDDETWLVDGEEKTTSELKQAFREQMRETNGAELAGLLEEWGDIEVSYLDDGLFSMMVEE